MLLYFAALLLFASAAACAITYTWTTAQYKSALRTASGTTEPAHVPYVIPWLGSAIDFLTPYPGRYFGQLLSYHPRETGACSALLGGKTTHFLFSATAVQALFKIKSAIANRDTFNKTIIVKSFGLSDQDWTKVARGGNREEEEEMTTELLMRTSYVNELTRTITKFLKEGLTEEKRRLGQDGDTVDLYPWIRDLMFKASVTTFYGARILDVYPGLLKDFWDHEGNMLDLFFGIPRFLKPASYAALEQCLDGLTRWIVQVDRETESKLTDVEKSNEEWEPIWGSRISRARQALWKDRRVSDRGRASMELGFLFGVNSNSIPMVSWMLTHIFDPKKPDLLSRVRKEIKYATLSTDAAGSAQVDTAKLTGLPLLQSIFFESLRMYVDVLVTREANQDLRLPLDESGESAGGRCVLLKKNSVIMAPSWPSHHDESYFTSPPASVFCPERFLVLSSDGKGDKYTFSSSAAGTKMWPWGGGKTMCPGRVFAKQEVLMAVAQVVLTFDIQQATGCDYTIPGFKKSYAGSGAIAPRSDLRVQVRARTNT